VDSAAQTHVRNAPPNRRAPMAGLPTLDGEFMAIYHEQGDSVVEIIARVRDSAWQRDREVWGGDAKGGVFFGRLRACLQGDQRSRILVLPSFCAGCDGDRPVFFLPSAATTGYIVGRRRPRR